MIGSPSSRDHAMPRIKSEGESATFKARVILNLCAVSLIPYYFVISHWSVSISKVILYWGVRGEILGSIWGKWAHVQILVPAGQFFCLPTSPLDVASRWREKSLKREIRGTKALVHWVGILPHTWLTQVQFSNQHGLLSTTKSDLACRARSTEKNKLWAQPNVAPLSPQNKQYW